MFFLVINAILEFDGFTLNVHYHEILEAVGY